MHRSPKHATIRDSAPTLTNTCTHPAQGVRRCSKRPYPGPPCVAPGRDAAPRPSGARGLAATSLDWGAGDSLALGSSSCSVVSTRVSPLDSPTVVVAGSGSPLESPPAPAACRGAAGWGRSETSHAAARHSLNRVWIFTAATSTLKSTLACMSIFLFHFANSGSEDSVLCSNSSKSWSTSEAPSEISTRMANSTACMMCTVRLSVSFSLN
mmetsp:Transcript_7023/g.17348  ORF Transcript_7023/g.17348 Transcript_7023/m.17348 type:complete len:210 (-) Transcript_7023:4330-4959(-)